MLRQSIGRIMHPLQRREGGVMPRLFGQIRRDRCGATAVEYALVALLISIAAFSVLGTIGTSVTGMFQSVASSF